jgi:hypothetical protein
LKPSYDACSWRSESPPFPTFCTMLFLSDCQSHLENARYEVAKKWRPSDRQPVPETPLFS